MRCSNAARGDLARVKSVTGNRLAIITNGGGTGVLAADTLADLQGTLAASGAENDRRAG